MAGFNDYHGDAGIGLGSTPAIPAEANVGLDVINQTGRDLLLLNHENNINIFKQKLADRQQQLKLLDAGQIQTGEILDSDRSVIQKYRENTNKEFDNFVKAGGVSNPDAARKYQSTVTELQDAITHAQQRYLGRKQLEKEKSSQPLQSMQADYDAHLSKEDKKGFYEGSYDPFQHSLTLDLDRLRKRTALNPYKYNVNDAGKQDPKGTTEVSGTQFSYPQTLQNLTDDYLEGADDMFHQQGLLKGVESMNPQQKARQIDAMNAQINRLNSENGLAEGDKGFVSPVLVTPDGRIAERPTDFTAKYLLSEQPLFRTENKKLDDKAANLALKTQEAKDRAAAERAKTGLGYAKLGEQRRLNDAKIRAMKNPEDQDKAVDDMYTRNLIEQQSVGSISNYKGFMGTTLGAGDRFEPANILAENSLPVYTIKNGKPAEVKPFGQVPIEETIAPGKTKITGYKGGYYKIKYTTTEGRPFSGQDILDLYNEFKKSKGVEKVTIDEFLKYAVDRGKMDYSILGENGSTDRKLHIAAQKIISNKSTKKNQQGVFDDGGDTDDSD